MCGVGAVTDDTNWEGNFLIVPSDIDEGVLSRVRDNDLDLLSKTDVEHGTICKAVTNCLSVIRNSPGQLKVSSSSRNGHSLNSSDVYRCQVDGRVLEGMLCDWHVVYQLDLD